MSLPTAAELRAMADDILDRLMTDGWETEVMFPGVEKAHPPHLIACSADHAFTLLKFTPSEGMPGVFMISVVGGGGRDMAPSEGLYQNLLMRPFASMWGGPIMALFQDGTAAFANRLWIPSALMSADSLGAATDYFTEMVDFLGRSGRAMASALQPSCGGRPFTGVDNDGVLLQSMTMN